MKSSRSENSRGHKAATCPLGQHVLHRRHVAGEMSTYKLKPGKFYASCKEDKSGPTIQLFFKTSNSSH